jgi:hypothetical protein
MRQISEITERKTKTRWHPDQGGLHEQIGGIALEDQQDQTTFIQTMSATYTLLADPSGTGHQMTQSET